ncbi:type II secretion system protein F [Propionigenium maris DSM 9537]|uniref:Type II secretion system protein F n=1 Tax=Propionigenium maris DSM 9537 TaxID=1123000 RepID=A0A9W6LPB3_9FUSO|nr:type II secretion system F family protein [Propionigenium maris]GLI57543.1 type II secretion system protein F [Propionigenium maris DSM 9537]
MYYYRCGDREGRVVEGYLNLGSKGEAKKQLEGNEYKIFELRREKSPMRMRRRGRDRREILLFSKIMASLLKAKIPLPETLSSVYTQIKDREFKDTIEGVIREVKSGVPLSGAFRKSPRYFNEFYCSIIEAGERNGVLEETFSMIYTYLLKKNKIEKKIVSASVYPAFLLIFSLVAIFFLSMVVLPSFANIYDAFEKELPYVTRAVLAVTGVLASYWHVALVLLGAGGYFAFEALRKEEYRRRLDSALLAIKPLKAFIYKREISGFFSILSLSIKSGMDIVSALNMSKKNIGNLKIRGDLEFVIQEVVRGQKFSRGLSYIGFPPLTIQFISAGESSDNLEEMLADVSKYYQEELEEGIDMVVSLIEPVMIIFVGGIIGVIVMAIMLPILSLSTAIS